MTRGAWLAAVLALPAFAQDPPPVVSTEQRGGTYIEPPAQVDPAYTPPGPDGRPTQPEIGLRLRLELSLDLPLRGSDAANVGSGSQGARASSPTVQALLRWHPLPQAHWFAQVVFYGYLKPDWQQAWHPDFSYAFGYDDWRPGTWHLVYANYTGTRWRPDTAAGEGRFNFPEGQWTAGYKFDLPRSLQPWLLVGDGDRAICSANGHVMPKYVEYDTGATASGKVSLSLACRYERPGGLFAQLQVFAYPDRSQQQPWDPDFTYGFGHADWRPGTVSVRYSNYSGNRFPGRERGPGEGTFRSGSVTVSWNLAW